MWDERESGDKRHNTADTLAGWIFVAVILLAVAAWSAFQLLTT